MRKVEHDLVEPGALVEPAQLALGALALALAEPATLAHLLVLVELGRVDAEQDGGARRSERVDVRREVGVLFGGGRLGVEGGAAQEGWGDERDGRDGGLVGRGGGRRCRCGGDGG